MISMFATGDFIRCSVKPGPYRDSVGAEVLLMGFVIIDGAVYGLVNGNEGQIGVVDTEALITDFIYDVERDRFIDRSAKEPEEPEPEG